MSYKTDLEEKNNRYIEEMLKDINVEANNIDSIISFVGTKENVIEYLEK